MTPFRRRYGAGPLHFLSLVACFAFAGYVVTIIHQVGDWERILVWFGAGVVGHDLVLFPLYALADRSAGWLGARRHPTRLPTVPWANHLRVPAVISAVLLAVSFPLVLNLANGTYQGATGLTVAPYAGRYLLTVGALFGTSAVLYAVRVGRALRRRRPGEAVRRSNP
jgi:hypothetical protein